MNTIYQWTIRCILLGISLFIVSLATAQDLQNLLRGKKNLRQISNTVDSIYNDHDVRWKGPNGDWPSIKQWKRWEWYMSGRLDDRAEITDITKKLQVAEREISKMESKQDPQKSINSFWSSIGPNTTGGAGIGRADRIAFHPSNANIFYVGTPAAGLWRTTDGGQDWEPLSDHLPSTGVSGIIVDWDDPSDLYVLTGDGDSDIGGFVEDFNYMRKSQGVMRSLDSGNTWTHLHPVDALPFTPYDMIQSPVDPGTFLIAASTGVYQSSNYGNTWQKTLSEPVYDVKFQPGTNRAYAASADTLYYSTDAGMNWDTSMLNVPVLGVMRVELAVSPANNNIVYALMGDVDVDSTFEGVFVSTDAGLSYNRRATTPNILGRSSNGAGDAQQARYDHSMAVSNTNASILITGGIQIWRSLDGGVSFGYRGNTHADIHDLAYNPVDNALYACTDGGVYRSTDNGTSWTSLFTNFSTSQLYHAAWTPEDNEYLLAGFQDNGIKLRSSNSSHFDDINGADGFDVSFYGGDKTRFYTTVNETVYRFWNSGANRGTITPPGGPDTSAARYDWFGTVRAHNTNNNIVFVGYDDVFVSTDDGNTYTNTGASGSWALETCPSNSNRIYAAGDVDYNESNIGTLWRSDSLGLNGWLRLDTMPGFPSTFTKITDIAVSPTNSNNILVTIGGFTPGTKVYRSLNGGTSWINWSGGLPDLPINCAAIAPGGSDYYIGTDLGVFYRNTNMSAWMPFSNAIPKSPVTELLVNSNEDKLIAATFGRGIWETNLSSNCQWSLAVISDKKGQFHYEAENAIISTSTMTGGVGTNMSLKAGNFIRLTPGFRASKHTKFRAIIGPCGEGGIPK